MRTIAFTFIQNDMVILDLWVRYYSQYFDDLLVFSKIELDWEEGQHYVRGLHNGFESECLQDVGLLLVHLRHADLNATGRDFGPMKHGPYGFVKERFGSRIDIPERFKDLL